MITATLGAYLGGLILYWLGYRIGTERSIRLLSKLPLVDQYEISLQCCGSNLYPDRASGAFNSQNPIATMYANREMDNLFLQARETGDAAKRAEIYKQIAKILNTDLPYNWLWAVANTHANTTRLSGFTYYPNARETFAQIEKWILEPAS